MSVKLKMATSLLYYLRNFHTFAFCISQGSLAICLRCGKMYYMIFVGNLIIFPAVKEFLKSVKI